MNWFIVPRLRPRPTTGRYPDWKEQILRNCGGQCVYCTISEGEYGGIDNFHVEHYRPKSLFASLENEIDNLYSACAVCNRFKGDDWPGEPDAAGGSTAFLDPGVADYHAHIKLVRPGVELAGTTVAGAFMIERLFLNREQLLTSRRYRLALAALKQATDYFTTEFDHLAGLGSEGEALIKEVAAVSLRLNSLQAQLAAARPYMAGETRRPAGARPKPSAVRRTKRKQKPGR